MKCPNCHEPDLLMTSREGIEIDYCPQCRGVWMDRGELDKIVERSARSISSEERREQPYYGKQKDSHSRSHKPKNMLKELFDF